MSLNSVTLTGTLPGAPNALAVFTPSNWLTAPADSELLPPAPVPVTLSKTGTFSVSLLATDNADLPSGWYWTVNFSGIGSVAPYSFSFFLAFANGATQDISSLATLPSPVPITPYLPVPSGTPSSGKVPQWTGPGQATAWTAPPGGAPSGSASGDLGGTYPGPTVVATHLASALPIAQGGTAAATAAAALASLGALPQPSGTPPAGQVPVATGTGQASKWARQPADWVNAVNEYGADPTGVADSAAAIQNAMNAQVTNGGVVYLPAGTYLISSASLQPVTKVRLTGAGKGATTLVSTTISIWNMGTSGITSNAEIDHLTMDCTGADAITAANLSKLYLHDCELIQRSAGFSVWNGAGLGQMIECRFERNEEFAHGATRTVPAWNLTSATSAVINQNVWRDIVSNNSDNDSTQYLYKIAYTGSASNAGHRSNVFENIVFERPCGGAIRLESCTGTLIDQCSMFDIAGLTVGASLISLAKNASAPVGTQSTMIRDYARLGGTSLNGNFDIQLDANCVQTTITAPSLNGGGAALAFDLGSSAQVTLSGLPSSYTLANAAGATFADANGTPFQGARSPGPADLALLAWSWDPASNPGAGLVMGTAGSASAGVLDLIKIPLNGLPISTTGVRVDLITLGSSLTSGQNFVFLYNSAGTFVAATADQTAAWNTGGTVGAVDANWASGPFTVSGSFCWVALLYNGTTGPSFLRGSVLTAAMANGKLPAAQSRYGSILSGKTTNAPGNFAPSSISQLSGAYWAGLF